MDSVKQAATDLVNSWAFLLFIVSGAFATAALFNIITLDIFDYPDFIEYTVALLRSWAVFFVAAPLAVWSKGRM